MKKILLITLGIFVFAQCSLEREIGNDDRYEMTYDKPAKSFIEAFVMGNGTMGATVYGSPSKERISLNDITLWSGEPYNPYLDTTAAKEALSEVREALAQEDYPKAESLARRLQGPNSNRYMPMGNVWIDFGDAAGVKDYERELDISKGVAMVEYELDGVEYSREIFVSHPDGVLVMMLEADKAGALNFNVDFESPLKYEVAVQNDILVATGYAPYNKDYDYDPGRGVHFAANVGLSHHDGNVARTETGISLKNATKAVLVISEATSFNGFDKDPVKEGRDYVAEASVKMKKALKKNYSKLKKRHVEDFFGYFNRADLQLGAPVDIPDMPLDKRLQAHEAGEYDPNLEMLYFQFGRYLMISASRTEGVPMNLQGLWNEQIDAPWRSNYTVNINTEENYWPAEVLNLNEMHYPLLTFLKNLSVNGAVSARNYWDVDSGWMCAHNSDIWAMTNPVGERNESPEWSNWAMGGAWMSTHLWEHYLYTMDKDYLKDYAYPLMRSAARFCMNILVDDGHGKLITSPATSPENHFYTSDGYNGCLAYGTTADLAIIRECIGNAKSAAEVLGVDADMQAEIDSVYAELYPYQIGHKGNLQEWYHDWEDVDPLHRHQSHLIGLYPGRHINAEVTPEFAAAAQRSLELRAGHSTGWSTGWRINLWARLYNGEMAYDIYKMLLEYVDGTKYKGGTYPNLLDAHPPFQIDGNFGGCSGVAEMLLQSHILDKNHAGTYCIDLLPALPNAWDQGSFRGFRARGGNEVSCAWKNGRVSLVEVKSLCGGVCTVRSRNPLKPADTATSKTVLVRERIGDWHVVSCDAEAGAVLSFMAE